MKRLRIATKECNYQEHVRQVKEQFIYGINDNMQTRINSELIAARNANKITSKQVP